METKESQRGWPLSFTLDLDITEENKCCVWVEEASFEATVYLFVGVKDKCNKVFHITGRRGYCENVNNDNDIYATSTCVE